MAIFNAADEERDILVGLSELGLDGEYTVRDLWRRKDIEKTHSELGGKINAHAAVLYLLKK